LSIDFSNTSLYYVCSSSGISGHAASVLSFGCPGSFLVWEQMDAVQDRHFQIFNKNFGTEAPAAAERFVTAS
jgi:hypothetical protein